jgi:glyoxylase-like metal-dependent hydrolase (beta-lactamase superfamily II)
VIAGLSSHPVRILFNTHWHPDHVGSNELLGRAGVTIIAHKNARYWLSRQVRIESFNTTVEPLKAVGLPVQTFPDGGKMTFGQEKIEYKWVPNSHTCTDAYVFIRSANVLHTGDLFFNGIYPVIDSTTGGWIGGMATALDKLLKVGDEQTKIIPGHGPLATRADMKAARDVLHTIYGRLIPLSKKRATIDEVLKANPVSDLEAKWGGGGLNGEQFLRMAYPSIAIHAQQMKNAAAGKGW